MIDIALTFAHLRDAGERQHHVVLGGVDIRLVRLQAGDAGRWDRHDDSPETVVVWSGSFEVAYRDHTAALGPGQCCVVPRGADHLGSSSTGAEIVLFRAAAPPA